MRKRTIKHLFDTIFWFMVYIIPLIIYFAYLRSPLGPVTFFGMFTSPDFGIMLSNNNPLIVGLFTLFGDNGILPLFADPGIFAFCGYFISCWIIHLAVDVLLFIVRWSHSMLDGFLGGKHD